MVPCQLHTFRARIKSWSPGLFWSPTYYWPGLLLETFTILNCCNPLPFPGEHILGTFLSIFMDMNAIFGKWEERWKPEWQSWRLIFSVVRVAGQIVPCQLHRSARPYWELGPDYPAAPQITGLGWCWNLAQQANIFYFSNKHFFPMAPRIETQLSCEFDHRSCKLSGMAPLLKTTLPVLFPPFANFPCCHQQIFATIQYLHIFCCFVKSNSLQSSLSSLYSVFTSH